MGSELKKWLAFLVVVTMALAGCGGGGGSDYVYSPPAEYTGETAQATLTSDNSEAIALEVFDGGSAAGGLAVTPMAAEGEKAAAGPLAIARILEKAVLQANQTSGVQMAAVGDCTPVPGDSSGTACFSFDASSTEYSFSGTVAFENYSDDGTISISGTVSFAGSYNQWTDTVQMTITYGTTTAVIDGENFTLHGSLSFTVSQNETGSDQFSFRMVMDNTTTGKQAFYDFAYNITYTDENNDGFAEYDEVSVSGRFYSSDHGYVVVSTVTPLRSLAAESMPSSGQLRFDGASSWATMTFTAEGAYTIECSDGGTPVSDVLN